MSGTAKTALEQARDRFLEGLADRARELQAALALLAASPGETRLQHELRRRVHSLYAAAQVVSLPRLTEDARDVLSLLDAAIGAGEAMVDDDIDRIAELISTLPALGRPRSEGAPAVEAPARLVVAARLSRPPAPDEQPLEVTQTAAGFLPAPAAVALMVVDAPEVIAAVRAALPDDNYEISGTPDPERAVQLMRSVAPDLVLVDAGLASRPELDLVRRLRTDPVVDARCVVLLTDRLRDLEGQARRAGADAALLKPVDADALREVVREHATVPAVQRSVLQGLEGGTVSDIAEHVAEEIRRGIAEALQVGHSERITLEERSELMAAAWSAVGRVRSHLQAVSEGRVQFRDAMPGGGPAALALTAPGEGDREELEGISLSGRRVLVADDDPAVVWFFAGLLREAGASVIEARDGTEALELARLRRPDVVVSDILMPGVDGFALCRELKRDLLLSEVPVVLLSWKEDFLQRMRELESGAAGYLRKEAGSQQILDAVRDVLRPRARLEAQLVTSDEVRGRVEGLGVPFLLESVARHRPDAHLVVRDALSVFEVDLRGGSELAIVRTGSDGVFSRGREELMQLLGVRAGRFTVTHAEGPLRNAFEQPLPVMLREATRRLGALLDAVSDARLMSVAAVEFDEERLPSLLAGTPPRLRQVVEHLQSLGAGERILLQSGMSPQELEQDLRELARRGAIHGVFDVEGEDLVRRALREREERPGTLLHSTMPPPSPVPPAPGARPPTPAPPPATPPRPVRAVALEQALAAAPPPPEVRPPAQPQRAPADTTPAPPLPADGEEEPLEEDDDEDALAPRRRSRAELRRLQVRSIAASMLVLAVMAALGLGGLVRSGARSRGAPSPDGGSAPPASAPAPGATTSGTKPMDLGVEPAADAARDGRRPPPVEVGFGRVLPFIDRGRGVDVPPGHGLLAIEQPTGDGTPHAVRVGDRALGTVPVEVALPPGRYEVVFTGGGRSSFRYLLIRAGETRVVTPPAPRSGPGTPLAR